VISIAQDYGKVNALVARIVILTSYAEDEVLLDAITFSPHRSFAT